tara:strand:- start:313 stop:759 length:447 start_codon:yes stop_codon:yes gene_type:complete
MKSRYRAEAISVCDAGLSNYLSKAHKKRVSSGILTGILIGGISTGGLYIYQRVTGSSLDSLVSILPLFFGAISGAGYGILTSEKNDSQSTSDFNSVCDELEAEEEQDYAHSMYDCKTGKEYIANTEEEHNDYAALGYVHDMNECDGEN